LGVGLYFFKSTDNSASFGEKILCTYLANDLMMKRPLGQKIVLLFSRDVTNITWTLVENVFLVQKSQPTLIAKRCSQYGDDHKSAQKNGME
jgi:hypothetical protein